jgi:hypothetical protein
MTREALIAARDALEETTSLLAAMVHGARPRGEIEREAGRCRAALSEIEAALAEGALGGWRLIESAPKDGTTFWASGLNMGKGPGRHQCEARWETRNGVEGFWDPHEPQRLQYLTHWMPIPAPPTQGGGE